MRGLLLVALLIGQAAQSPSTELPARAATRLAQSLKAARGHTNHVWRDTVSVNQDGTVNAYVEIGVGDRNKWEYDMRKNRRELDRVLPRGIGAYPVNYGFVPQTISYDGDPFDALVLGPALPEGHLVRGVIVGVLLMEDEKGQDAKVVLSTTDADGRPRHALTDRERQTIGTYFATYKRLEPGKFSRVHGWGDEADGLLHVKMTHAFFTDCRHARQPCRLAAP